MVEKQKIPFGLWPSLITPQMQGGLMQFGDVQFDQDDSLLWVESVSGKTSLMLKKGLEAERKLSGDLKVGGGLGYGGGDFTVRNGLVVFASGGRLYKVSTLEGLPEPITPAFGDCAAPVISPDGSRVIFIQSYERKDCLAMVALNDHNWPVKLAQSADFYMQPTWHPDSQRIAWIEWDHPQMPWDGTRLMMARVSASGLDEIHLIHGSTDIPVFQPEFSADGRYLSFLSNEGEWDTLYVMDLSSGEKRPLVSEASLIEPAWGQGMRSHCWSPDSKKIYFFRNEKGWRKLWELEVASGKTSLVDTNPYTWLVQLAASPVSNRLAFIASSSKITPRVVSIENGIPMVQKRSSGESIPGIELSEPTAMEWPASDGTTVHGLYYPPSSTHYSSDGLPPAIVHIHGGPTASMNNSYNAYATYFTTRGYAFLEVNYRGSTGYGRKYMLMLRKKWGLIDTEDAVGGARALAALGLADARRMVVMGGSAGGYVVLNALIQFPGIFKAGIDTYGVSDLFGLLKETHKFEERYTDSMVGVLPEAAERFKAWSPIFHADKIKDPIAIFQGDMDKVVPPSQSEQIVAVLKNNKVPHIYKLYPGEGHGFRKTETIIDFHETMDNFLQKYVLF